MLTERNRGDLAAFLGRSVLSNTRKTYDRHWELWKKFLSNESATSDPFLKGVDDDEKSALVGLFLLRRYEAGHRGKSATSVTAGIRLRFTQELESTTFLDSAIITTARTSCKLSPTELRTIRNAGASDSVKLPICAAILTDMRERLWNGHSWNGTGVKSRMAYLGCIWGFDQSVRISEYTRPEPGSVDHCVRVDDLTFYMSIPSLINGIVGSELSNLCLSNGTEVGEFVKQIMECRLLPASCKNKPVVKSKLISRRSPEEVQFFEDLGLFIIRSRSEGEDNLFSHRENGGRSVSLTGKTVRTQVKLACGLHGLPPAYFSSHSLRKAGFTHLRSAGATEDDRRDRGNYAPNSPVMNQTYDYATGLGPLASNSLVGGVIPSVIDVRRLIPAPPNPREQVRGNALG